MNEIQLLLISLMEECDELSQRCSKALRFGLSEVQPGQELTNEERINYEFNDLMAIVKMLSLHGIHLYELTTPQIAKQEKVHKYMKFSRKKGVLK